MLGQDGGKEEVLLLTMAVECEGQGKDLAGFYPPYLLYRRTSLRRPLNVFSSFTSPPTFFGSIITSQDSKKPYAIIVCVALLVPELGLVT